MFGWDSGMNSLEECGPGSTRKPDSILTINSTTLDSELDWHDRSIAIKIDVEGHELATLAGAKQLLSRNIAIAQIEINGNRAEVLQKMKEVGYRRIFEVRRDLYFTNAPALDQEVSVLACVQRAMGVAVNNSHRRIVQIPRKPKTLWRFLRKKPFYF